MFNDYFTSSSCLRSHKSVSCEMQHSHMQNTNVLRTRCDLLSAGQALAAKNMSHEAPQNAAASLTTLISLNDPVFNFRARLEWQGRTKHLICRQCCKHSSFMRGYRGTTGCKIKLCLQCRKALLNMHARPARVLRGDVSSWDIILVFLEH